MRVLITNLHFGHNSGSEVVVELLAEGLRRAGHAPMLLAPDLGRQGFAARERGHVVVDRVSALPAPPDIIHAQHTTVALAAFAAFPDVPAVFSCHSAVFEVEAPRPHPQIRRWIAVDDFCRDKCFSRGVPVQHLHVIPNAVDLERYARRAPLPKRPTRALLLTKNSGHQDAVREACAASRIALDELGPSVGRVSTELERELPKYDLVFATARMALEAAAVGSAVIVCDGRGFAGLLNSANLAHWRSMNLGVGLLTRPTTPDAVRDAIEQYDAEDAEIVTDRVRADASLPEYIARHLAVYAEALADPPRDLAACKAATVAWIEDLAPTPTDRAWRAVAREAVGFQGEPMDRLMADVEQRVQQELRCHAEKVLRLSAEVTARFEDRLAARLDEWRRVSDGTMRGALDRIHDTTRRLDDRLDQATRRLTDRLDTLEQRVTARFEARSQSGLWPRMRRLWRETVPHVVRKPLFDLRQRLLRRGRVL